MNDIIKQIQTEEHGFKIISSEATKLFQEKTPEECFKIAQELIHHEIYQARMLAVFLLGFLASKNEKAFAIMKNEVSKDDSWKVQEILAQAFDRYCKDTGYEKVLPVIKEWLKDKNPNVRRAVSEGLRIWNYKDYFKQHPDIAIQLLSQLKDDESDYVRKSAGNALRDISRKEKDLVRKEVSTWDLTNKKIKFTYDLASKFL